MVDFDAVAKEYGDLRALEDASFRIERGGIVGLLGPNGAGKTTTMRIMTGYLAPSRGTVTIDGTVFTPDSVETKRKIGYLPENAPVYGDMLAYDYLVYEARVHGVDPAARVPEVIRQCGLADQAHKPIRELSKGYRQRVGLAHTLLNDPELLILDEPTSGLDPNQIIEVRRLIREISKTKTVILSTHIMQEVEALCDRVIIIHRGRIRFDGPMRDVAGSLKEQQLIRLTAGEVAGEELCRLVSQLDEVAEAREVSGEPGLATVEIRAAGTVELRPVLFRLAVDRGFLIYELSRERTSVEQLFQSLTQEAADESVEASR
ncbi:MAG: ATP-binding cassette domain-containing protein [Alkalispirochaetaceae bacterium]